MKIAIILVNLFVCFSTKAQCDVVFKIVNKNIKDDSDVLLEINNCSFKKYFLPILNSELSRKNAFLSAEYLFFVSTNLKTDKGTDVCWYSDNCYFDYDLEKIHQKFVHFKKKMRKKDIILLEPKTSVIIKIPFTLIRKISENCSWSIKNFDNNEKYKIFFSYSKYDVKEVEKALNKQLLDELIKMGYEFYNSEIISNDVPLILE